MYEWPYSCSAVTAEALKIITAPSRHSPRVTMNSQRSFSSRLGILSPRIHRIPGRTKLFALFQLAHQLFEDAAALFVILKLIEAGAGRSEQHDISWMSCAEGAVHCVLQRANASNRYATLDLLFD